MLLHLQDFFCFNMFKENVLFDINKPYKLEIFQAFKLGKAQENDEQNKMFQNNLFYTQILDK